jgi:hypothetical protein
MVNLEKLEDFVWLGKIIVAQSYPEKAFLTENPSFRGKSSYILSSRIPEIQYFSGKDYGYVHGSEKSIISTTDLPNSGMLDSLANEISLKARRLEMEELMKLRIDGRWFVNEDLHKCVGIY